MAKKVKGLITVLSTVLIFILFSNQSVSAHPSLKMTKMGTPITNSTAITSSMGQDAKGNAMMYIILQGEPAQLAVFNIFTKEMVDVKPLTHSTGGWAIKMAPNGEVWIGGTP